MVPCPGCIRWWQAQHSTPAVRRHWWKLNFLACDQVKLVDSELLAFVGRTTSWRQEWKAWQHTWSLCYIESSLVGKGDSSRTVGVRLRLGVPLHSYCVVLLVVYGSTTTRNNEPIPIPPPASNVENVDPIVWWLECHRRWSLPLGYIPKEPRLGHSSLTGTSSKDCMTPFYQKIVNRLHTLIQNLRFTSWPRQVVKLLTPTWVCR